jgi:hypothetical protein
MKLIRILCAVLIAVLTNVGCRVASEKAIISNDSNNRKPKNTIQDKCRTVVLHYEREDLPEAEILKLFEQLARDGDSRGTMWLARFNDLGRLSVPLRPDVAQTLAKEAIESVTELAEKGDPEAQFLMGAAYQQSLGVELSLERAFNWYSKAAAAGQATAMNNLGYMLANGHGTELDIDKARFWWGEASKLGSVAASRNLSKEGNHKHNDGERFKLLRSVPIVQALGMKKDDGIKFLVSKSLISDSNGYEADECQGLKLYSFRADGIVLGVDISGRITQVEGHAKSSLGTNQFRGEIPLGLSWKDDGNAALKILGEPNFDRGYVKNDNAYAFVYQIDNLAFGALIGYEGDQTLKLFRVFEIWASNYSKSED